MSESEIEIIAKLASECFVTDEFYRTLEEDQEIRKEIIKNLFTESIRICNLYGKTYTYQVNSEYVWFALVVNWTKLKNDKKSFNYLFSSSNSNLDSKLIKELEFIENILDKDQDWIYLLAICVSTSYRRKGIATLLIRKIIEDYSYYNIFADISNQNSIELYRQLGFEILETIENCTFVKHLKEN